MNTSKAVSEQPIPTKENVVDMNEAGDMPPAFQRRPSIMEALAGLTGLLARGEITTRQAREIRQQLGIHQSYFTRRRISDKKRKFERTRARHARAVNHHNLSTKGQIKSGRA